jgi:hypothetical protein
MKSSIIVLLAAASAAIAPAALADTVIVNGGFENGTGADASNWNEFSGGAAGTSSGRAFGLGLSGDYALSISAVGDVGIGAFAGAVQNSIADGGLASLAGLSTAQLSFSANVDLGPGGVGFYALRILDSSGAIVADTGLQALTGTGGGWQTFTTASLNVPALGAAPGDAYAAFVEIVVNAGAFSGSTASALIDNVDVTGTLIPAPGAAMVLGLAGLAATRRRR